MKGSPCGAGLKWSCLHAHSTTCTLIALLQAWWGVCGGKTDYEGKTDEDGIEG